MRTLLALTVCLLSSLASAQWGSDPPYFSQRYAGVPSVRGLHVDPSGDLLALQQGNNGGVQVLYEEQNGDGTINVVQTLIVPMAGLGLNHAVIFHNGYIYAASPTVVYRWPYTPGTRTPVTVAAERVIEGIPNGGHNTRSITFDSNNLLYVQVGSNANVDNDSSRSRIRRFALAGLLPIPFNTGEVFADGLRNEVGLAWDANGVLHGVENGADNANRPDMGGDIHNTNPAEEMNRFDGPVGTHYGYPFCFSSHTLQDFPKGTQFVWNSFMNDGIHSDAWCRNTSNNRPPLFPMPAHVAPLGIEFYHGQNCGQPGGAFPCSFTGDAFVSMHGSWNANPPVGYRVSRFPFANGDPTGDEVQILVQRGGSFRPVNAVFTNNGHLIVSADAQGVLVKVTYGEAAPIIKENIVR